MKYFMFFLLALFADSTCSARNDAGNPIGAPRIWFVGGGKEEIARRQLGSAEFKQIDQLILAELAPNKSFEIGTMLEAEASRLEEDAAPKMRGSESQSFSRESRDTMRA